jgi:ketosteroid isomerase-like protein
MKTLTLLWLALTATCLTAAGLDPKTEAIHNELRALRAGVLDAINKGDIERELSFLHTNVVVTWHNAEVSRGREGVREYYQRLTGGPKKQVEKFSAEITVDELTILHGGSSGISYGSSVEHFQLSNGRTFDLNGRWSATVVREEGRWLIASLHASTNLFDNVILSLSQKSMLRLAGVASLIGLACGWFIGRVVKRRPSPQS